MSANIFIWSLTMAQILLLLAMVCALIRLLRGPSAQDRILALDTLYTNGLLLLITYGIRFGSALYFEAAIAVALLGFASTVALAKFLIRGEVIE